jgi:hypothetical protein
MPAKKTTTTASGLRYFLLFLSAPTPQAPDRRKSATASEMLQPLAPCTCNLQ